MKQLAPLLLLLVLFSCQKEAGQLDTGIDAKVDTVFKDVSYGGNKSNVLDLYLPAGRADTTPMIILIHGGGWNAGSRSELSFMAKRFQAKGYAVANIDYRLSPASDDNFKMQLDNIGSVVDFLTENSGKYIYSPKRFYTTGHSAGGHLSLSYAYTRNQSRLIKAAAGMAAPTNLHNMAYYNPVLFESTLTPYLGAPLSSATEERYKSASPVYQATAAVVPTILFQGDLDFIVSKDQANSLAARLDELKVPNKKIIYPLTFHDWWQNGDFVSNTVNETIAWFNKYR